MRKRLRAATGGAAVGRLADAVEDAAEQAGADREMQRLAEEAHAHVRAGRCRWSTPAPRPPWSPDRARRRGRAWAAGRRCGFPPPRSGRPRRCVAGTKAGLRSRSPCLAPMSSGRMRGLSEIRPWRPRRFRSGRKISRSRPRRSPRPCAAGGAARRARRCAAAARRARARPPPA